MASATAASSRASRDSWGTPFSNAESVLAVRALLELEGIFAGVSCGAAIHVARKIAEEMDEGVIVTILTDAGWKYLSADFWEAPEEELAESMERTIWW